MSNGWHVTTDSFQQQTPIGNVQFSNIIANTNPNALVKLTFAAHYDSLYSLKGFVGATDSAVPCAMLLDLSASLKKFIPVDRTGSISMQLIFFDGEEAFVQWSETDSLYGSRHLANVFSQSHIMGTTQLQQMKVMVLLDLIGSTYPWPTFHDFYPASSTYFTELVSIENRMKQLALLHSQKSFLDTSRSMNMGGKIVIEDDHKPFVQKGVACVHLITYPFPSVWHTLNDNMSTLDMYVISDISKLMRVYAASLFYILQRTGK